MRTFTKLQGVGLIAAVGDGVKHLKVGTPAAIMTFGSYAEFSMVYDPSIFYFLDKISRFVLMFVHKFHMSSFSVTNYTAHPKC